MIARCRLMTIASILLVVSGYFDTPVHAVTYSVSASGVINQVFGTFDSSVHLGTPYTYTFFWDSLLPSVENASVPSSYDRQSWDGIGISYGANVVFGNYSSAPNNTTTSRVSKQNNTNVNYGVPDLMLHGSIGGSYVGSFSYAGTVDTQIERGAIGNVFNHTSQSPDTDWTFSPVDPNFSGLFWRLMGNRQAETIRVSLATSLA